MASTQSADNAGPTAAAGNPRRDRMISMVLAVLTVALYLRTGYYEFNNFDDAQYITRNPAVQHGLTAKSISWAFTTGYAGNWHPLTWLSHMLDWQIYGANAGGHHLTSVLIHAINAVLLFWVLRLMTGAAWRSAFVAALFAWHPMHVESAAWVAERKDVLSCFFGLLTLLAYWHYTKSPQWKRYVAVLLCFALGLMSKPMLVTLPVILLLLDFWPLKRIANPRTDLPRLLLEKLPLFALTALSCLATLKVQKSGGAMSLTTLSLGDRIANALNSYATYVTKIVWPDNLAVFYPHPGHIQAMQVAVAALFLMAITVTTLILARTGPYLPVGWFWFVIMLVPVIGIVQVGEQALADRYTYLPAVGLFIMAAWSAAQLLEKWPRAKPAIGLAGGVVLGVCVLVTSKQITYWKNSETLFTRALAVTKDNALAHCNLGEALVQSGKPEEAMFHFDEALRINPEYLQVINNKGSLYEKLGDLQNAVAQFTLALRLKPDWALAHGNLGLAYLQHGRLDDAITHLRAAIQLDPNDDQSLANLGLAYAKKGSYDDAAAQYRKSLAIAPNAFAENGLGGVLDLQGKTDEAAAHYLVATKIKPDFAEAHNNLGDALNRLGKFDDARTHLQLAVQLKPAFPEAHFNLANALFSRGQLTNAAAEYSEALKLAPNYAAAHLNLAMLLTRQGNDRAAIQHYRASLQSEPRPTLALQKLAWLLATSPDDTLRDGNEAVRLAREAILAEPLNPVTWDTLAAALAESGQFTEAKGNAIKALAYANSSKQTNLAPMIEARLKLYEAQKPYRETPVSK